MKKFVLLLFGILSLSAAIHAQDSSAQKKMPAMRQHRTDVMQQLNLTDDQKAKLKKLREEEKIKIDSVQSSTAIPDDQKQAQIRTIRQSQRKSMEDLLTPDQKSKWMEMHAQQMEKRKAAKQDSDSSQ